jgi:hypothetical protein
MKKSILLVLLVAFLATAVCISGCLGNDTPNTPETPTEFGAHLVTINPVPAGFELLAVRDVTADEEIKAISEALSGHYAAYMYNDSAANGVYLYAFQANNSSSAAGFVQAMIDAHKAAYPNTHNVTTVKINGHDVTLLTVVGSTGGEKYELAWTNGDILVVVNGPADYELMKQIAEASKL